ncbi:MAG: aspartyl protease family protein [Planctomycetota bacterium]
MSRRPTLLLHLKPTLACGVTLLVAATVTAQSPRSTTRPTSRLTELPMVSPFGLPLVKVALQGSTPQWLSFDTGATQTIIDRGWAEQLGFAIQDLGGSAQPGGRVQMGRFSGATMQLGGLDWPDRTFLAVALEPIEDAVGRPIPGIIGYDLLQSFVVETDYAKRRMWLHDPASFRYEGDGTILEIEIKGTKPMMPVTLFKRDGSAVIANFTIDAGSTQAVSLAAHFYPSVLTPDQVAVPARGWGFGGNQSRGLLLRIPRVEFGPYAFEEVSSHAVVADGTSGKRRWDGIIGGELLRRFNVIYDYSRGRMILEPNDTLRDPLRESLTGMEFVAEGGGSKAVVVYTVYQGSAADRAGVREGDLLGALNGKPVTSHELAWLWDRLRAGVGDEHHLRMRRGDAERHVALKLERLPLTH